LAPRARHSGVPAPVEGALCGTGSAVTGGAEDVGGGGCSTWGDGLDGGAWRAPTGGSDTGAWRARTGASDSGACSAGGESAGACCGTGSGVGCAEPGAGSGVGVGALWAAAVGATHIAASDTAITKNLKLFTPWGLGVAVWANFQGNPAVRRSQRDASANANATGSAHAGQQPAAR
jgi:hypothetical protein